MSEQDGRQAPTIQRPTTNDPGAWKAYWKTQNQPWRTEPEIDRERQEYLAERRSIKPDIEQGIYPFKDVKLNRADIEWLLSTHENGRKRVNLRSAQLEKANLTCLNLAGADLTHANLEAANFANSDLMQVSLPLANLAKANLARTNLAGADFKGANLMGTSLAGANLASDNLHEVFFLSATRLDGVVLNNKEFGTVSLADVHWGEVNLAVVDWSAISILGDEDKARQRKQTQHFETIKEQYLYDYQKSVRAYRQLTVVLRNQGLNEEADRFAYRAQLLQRVVWRLQRRPLKFILSWFLYLLAGYGYRPGRSVIWYLVTIFGFALAYFAIGHLPFFPDAFVFSLTSFHGRGFFPGLGNENSLHNPLVILAAFEAIVGLLIEISFIATFTQRFFGK